MSLRSCKTRPGSSPVVVGRGRGRDHNRSFMRRPGLAEFPKVAVGTRPVYTTTSREHPIAIRRTVKIGNGRVSTATSTPRGPVWLPDRGRLPAACTSIRRTASSPNGWRWLRRQTVSAGDQIVITKLDRLGRSLRASDRAVHELRHPGSARRNVVPLAGRVDTHTESQLAAVSNIRLPLSRNSPSRLGGWVRSPA